MLLIVGAVIMLIAVVIIPRMRISGGMNASTLGAGYSRRSEPRSMGER